MSSNALRNMLLNDPESIEIVIPVPSNELEHIDPCIQALLDNTTRNYRLSIAVFGFLKESKQGELNTLLKDKCSGIWEITSSKDACYNEVVHHSIKASTANLVIILPYDVRIQDKGWFGKLQQPIDKAFDCGMAYCHGTQDRSTLPPYRMSKWVGSSDGILMTTRKVIQAVIGGVEPGKQATDYVPRFHQALNRSGMTSFLVPSIGSHRVETNRKKRPVTNSRSGRL
jgi:hypothetical protein